MVQRGANHPRRANDDYATPGYVVEELLKFMGSELSPRLCDPAPGAGQLVSAFKQAGYREVTGPRDFLLEDWNGERDFDFLMNPPYGRQMKLAVAFINKALTLSRPWRGKVVALMQFDFDCAGGRRYLFEHRAFAGKIVIPRIEFFNDQEGSLVHAWFVWDHKHEGRPWIWYMPKPGPDFFRPKKR